MHQKWQNFPSVFGISANALAGARFPFDYRIDSFQVAGVGREPDLDLRARSEPAHSVITEVVFHVAVAGDQVGNVILAKLGEDNFERFSQKIREHIEPPAMRHAHADLFDAALRAFVQDCLKSDHQCFRSLQREAFLPDEAGMQEDLE